MLKTRIIPCLDVADGRVVKGVNFVDLIDAGDPVEAAKAYDAAGADELCFLDIHATHENRGTMFDLVTRTAEGLACWVNRCAHRGAMVCREKRGNAASHTCVYHQFIGMTNRRCTTGWWRVQPKFSAWANLRRGFRPLYLR